MDKNLGIPKNYNYLYLLHKYEFELNIKLQNIKIVLKL